MMANSDGFIPEEKFLPRRQESERVFNREEERIPTCVTRVALVVQQMLSSNGRQCVSTEPVNRAGRIDAPFDKSNASICLFNIVSERASDPLVRVFFDVK